MEREILLDHLEGEVAELLDSAGAAASDLDAVAPGCAPMTGREVISHVGTVYLGVRQWIVDGRRPVPWPIPPDSGDLAGWVTAAAHELIDTLLPRKAPAPCATWCPWDRTNGFWFRRMAHETAVHRVDVAQALGRPWSVDPALASDGIEEAIELRLGTALGAEVGGSGRTVVLDTPERDWRIRPTVRYFDFPSAGPADATVAGDTAAVWAWVWGRADTLHPVTISGDTSAAEELRQLFARTMQ